MMKLSIITVSFNSENHIYDAIKSVNEQTYPNIEHIFIDGGSTDQTFQVIKNNSNRQYQFLSEPDNGIYDAMNKGYKMATGDVIAFLNSDDFYDNCDILTLVMDEFDYETDIVYGDIYFIDQQNLISRIWHTGHIPINWQNGFQIPHPALFVRKRLIANRDALYDIDFKIAGDLKLQLSLFKDGPLNTRYLEKKLVCMRLGGASTKNIQSIVNGFKETRRAYNDIFGEGGTYYELRKIASKINQKILGNNRQKELDDVR